MNLTVFSSIPISKQFNNILKKLIHLSVISFKLLISYLGISFNLFRIEKVKFRKKTTSSLTNLDIFYILFLQESLKNTILNFI